MAEGERGERGRREKGEKGKEVQKEGMLSFAKDE